MRAKQQDTNEGEGEKRHDGNAQKPEQRDVGLRTGDTLHTGLGRFWNDPGNQEYVIEGNEPSYARQCTGISHNLGVMGEQAKGENQGQGVHCNSLIPAQRTNRNLHDFAEEEAAEGGAGGYNPGGEEQRPAGLDARGKNIVFHTFPKNKAVRSGLPK